jgi:hypothetical protein
MSGMATRGRPCGGARVAAGRVAAGFPAGARVRAYCAGAIQ